MKEMRQISAPLCCWKQVINYNPELTKHEPGLGHRRSWPQPAVGTCSYGQGLCSSIPSSEFWKKLVYRLIFGIPTTLAALPRPGCYMLSCENNEQLFYSCHIKWVRWSPDFLCSIFGGSEESLHLNPGQVPPAWRWRWEMHQNIKMHLCLTLIYWGSIMAFPYALSMVLRTCEPPV